MCVCVCALWMVKTIRCLMYFRYRWFSVDLQSDVKPLPAVSVTTLFTPEVIAEINAKLAEKQSKTERKDVLETKRSMSDDETPSKEKNEVGCVIC